MWGKGSVGESMGACEHPRQRGVVESASSQARPHSLSHNAPNHTTTTAAVPAHRRATTPDSPAATAAPQAPPLAFPASDPLIPPQPPASPRCLRAALSTVLAQAFPPPRSSPMSSEDTSHHGCRIETCLFACLLYTSPSPCPLPFFLRQTPSALPDSQPPCPLSACPPPCPVEYSPIASSRLSILSLGSSRRMWPLWARYHLTYSLPIPTTTGSCRR